MSDIKYTTDHEWVRVENGEAAIGITEYAQDALGELVFIELPDVGAEFAKGAEVGVLESVKAASEIYAPVSGTITAVNDALADEPTLVNQSPFDKGWLFRISMNEPSECDSLLDEAGYNELTGE